MALWGKQNAVASKPKHLPEDSNAPHGREFCAATTKGWVMQPGVASAATGNDNTSADPEILVAIGNLTTNRSTGKKIQIIEPKTLELRCTYSRADVVDTDDVVLRL